MGVSINLHNNQLYVYPRRQEYDTLLASSLKVAHERTRTSREILARYLLFHYAGLQRSHDGGAIFLGK